MEETRNQELMKKIAYGEEAALSALYKEIGTDVFAFALSILKNYHDAEDVMQEVFLKIRSQASTCRDFKSVNGWIIRITKNTALDFIRKKKRHIVDEELAKGAIDRDRTNSLAEHSIFINEVFNELTDQERPIVVLHLMSDLTHKSIAKALDLPLTTVKWRYRKAILHLEKIWEKEGWRE